MTASTNLVARLQAADFIQQQANRILALEADKAALRSDVIAFAAPWADQYARDHGLPSGHLHPQHYDLLEKCGARMTDFTRAALDKSE